MATGSQRTNLRDTSSTAKTRQREWTICGQKEFSMPIPTGVLPSVRLHLLQTSPPQTARPVGTNLLNTWTYWGYFSFRSTQSKTPCKLNVLLGKEHFCSFGDIDHPIHLWTQSTLYTVVWGDITQHTLYSGVRKYSWMKLTLVTWTIR